MALIQPFTNECGLSLDATYLKITDIVLNRNNANLHIYLHRFVDKQARLDNKEALKNEYVRIDNFDETQNISIEACYNLVKSNFFGSEDDL